MALIKNSIHQGKTIHSKTNQSITIPIYKPLLNGNESKYVHECLQSNWISSKGQFVSKFEKQFANYIGIKHASSITNGTCALHLALLALNIKTGDEVIVPTLTYVASANAITYTGATPVFVDSLMNSWQMNPQEIEQKITAKTKAILVVHLYGHPCNMEYICSIAKKHNLFIIEDCAEALGSTYKNQHVGTFGNIAAYSFYGNKTITTGEGGMVVTNDENLYKKVQKLKGQGLAEHTEYWHDVVGYNYRMTNICAAIGLAQLEKIDAIIAKKREIALFYKKYLKNLTLTYHEEEKDVFHSYWMFSILAKTKEKREFLRKKLLEFGIETRPVFNPIHSMPMYNKNHTNFPIAQTLSDRGINLPSWPGLKHEEIKYIVQTIKNA